MTNEETIAKITKAVTDKFIAEGKLIEAGFAAFAIAFIPMDAPQSMIGAMRVAYFSGAQHLFGTMMNMMDEGVEPTDADLKKVDKIDEELRQFVKTLKP